jgi:hypothetical protein
MIMRSRSGAPLFFKSTAIGVVVASDAVAPVNHQTSLRMKNGKI